MAVNRITNDYIDNLFSHVKRAHAPFFLSNIISSQSFILIIYLCIEKVHTLTLSKILTNLETKGRYRKCGFLIDQELFTGNTFGNDVIVDPFILQLEQTFVGLDKVDQAGSF